jgi:hypothetical protein
MHGPDLPVLRPAAASPRASVTYYVDSVSGSDSSPGTSQGAAWKTVKRANAASLNPGDSLLFADGQTFDGALRIERSGESGRPVTIGSFGRGRATLLGEAGDGIVLTRCSFVRIHDIDVRGSGRKNGNDGRGISLVDTRDVELDRVDVSGFRLAGVHTSGDRGTRITHVNAHDNGGAGITADSGYGGRPRSRDLYIGHCRADNNPGDPKNLENHSGNGIVVGGVDGCLIEFCEASNNGWDMPRDGNGPVGIWGWNCDRLVIQRCLSHDNKSPGADGGGFDFDGGVTNSILQYNLSYNNQGCGFLLCQYPGASPWRDNVVRYNISIDDGSRNLHSGIGLWEGGTGISNAEIYNNTIVNSGHAVNAMNDMSGFVYRNNIFVSGEEVIHGPHSRSRFQYNLYHRTSPGPFCIDGKHEYATLEEWSREARQEMAAGKIVGMFVDPGFDLNAIRSRFPTDPADLARMTVCQLGLSSPAVGAGEPIPTSGSRDFFGSPVSATSPPSLGAHEPRR